MNSPASTPGNPWLLLKRYTAARIGLGRSGAGLPTAETLHFKLAHARARDAVHAPLQVPEMIQKLKFFSKSVFHLHSAARDRAEYLHRPDLGRQLHETSQDVLERESLGASDLAIVVADGLSALAIERNVVPFLMAFLPLVAEMSLAPLVVVEQGRVAVGDEIGFRLKAKCVAVLIGERPGLSSPDSLGIYMTYDPHPGLTDERRNCISNIREGGLSMDAGARKLDWLIRQAFFRQISGVDLKDEMSDPDVLKSEISNSKKIA